jgi:hypothetical protein
MEQVCGYGTEIQSLQMIILISCHFLQYKNLYFQVGSEFLLPGWWGMNISSVQVNINSVKNPLQTWWATIWPFDRNEISELLPYLHRLKLILYFPGLGFNLRRNEAPPPKSLPEGTFFHNKKIIWNDDLSNPFSDAPLPRVAPLSGCLCWAEASGFLLPSVWPRGVGRVERRHSWHWGFCTINMKFDFVKKSVNPFFLR